MPFCPVFIQSDSFSFFGGCSCSSMTEEHFMGMPKSVCLSHFSSELDNWHDMGPLLKQWQLRTCWKSIVAIMGNEAIVGILLQQ
jgi:hypothetical protein